MSSQPVGSVEPLLSVRDLVIEFDTPDGPIRAVHGISFDVMPGEVFCIVGESGSGKSLTMLAVMGLLPAAAHIRSGEIRFRGEELRGMPASKMREIRGNHLAMVFQDPMTALNPVVSIGRQLSNTIKLHAPGLSRGQRRARAVDLLAAVRVPNAAARYSEYPNQFSGGMRQRALIAMAMAHSPQLLIADEPTTALDVTVQAQVLEVLSELRQANGASMVLITHDLGLVAEVADRVLVMYGGRVMEVSSVEDIFARPRHPYTAGLLASVLEDPDADTAFAIPGSPPTLGRQPSGCVFHTRCALRQGRSECVEHEPALRTLPNGRAVACHFADEVGDLMPIVTADAARDLQEATP
jgi:oligopeptide/dipeptide ABC transporter ATP-binding protein